MGQETATKINNVLLRLFKKHVINQKQYAHLTVTPAAKPRPFYLLHKVHKCRNKWPDPLQPEGRPTVSDCGSETDKYVNS